MLQLLRSPELELQGQIVTPKDLLALDVLNDFAAEVYDWKHAGRDGCGPVDLAVWIWLCRFAPNR